MTPQCPAANAGVSRARSAQRTRSQAQAGSADPAAGSGAAGADAAGRPCLAALIENTQREVGLAFFNPATMTLTLAQFIEASRSYTTTSQLLETHDVGTAVLVESAAQQRVFAAGGVAQAAQSLALHHLPRKLFDDTRGLEMIMACCEQQSMEVLSRAQVHASHYLALGAAGALLKHLSNVDSWGMPLPGTLTVGVQGTEKHMLLDAGSIASLEVVRPSVNSSIHVRGKPRSLLELLQHTRTSAGARLLRSSLLQPVTDIATLEARYDCLQELLDNEEQAMGAEQCLSALPRDLDKMCAAIALKQARSGDHGRHIGSTITNLILLRDVMRGLPTLADTIEGLECCLAQAIRTTFLLPEFDDMLSLVEEVIDPEAQVSKVPFMNKIQQCFAIKPGADPMLEVARTAFGRNTALIHSLAAKYQDQLGPGVHVKACYSLKRSFYLAIAPAKALADAGSRSASDQLKSLPREFIIMEHRPRDVWCTTDELNALNSRLQDAATSCLEMAAEVLDALVSVLVTKMPHLQRLIDAVALLDMMLAFAHVVGTSPNASFVRPELSTDGPLAIVQGRHPILDVAHPSTDYAKFMPNDCFVSAQSCLHIISGVSASGKSTYLRQVALLVIMAQAGCFVPAQLMSLAPFKRLFTRMGNGDSIETNSSTFMCEMHDVAHILQHAGPHSLVLLDELGRATSTCDGLAIAWAVCEKLASMRCFTIIASHLRQLSGLAQMHSYVKLWELQVKVADGSLDFLRTLAPANKMDFHHHGLLAAKALGMPEPVLAEAERVASLLEAKEQDRKIVSMCNHSNRSQISALAGRLEVLAQQKPWCRPEALQSADAAAQRPSSEDWDGLKSLLQELQDEAKSLDLNSAT